MSDAQSFMENMYSKLDNFLKTETVIGEPIEAGPVTLIPIISASFGLGGGLGSSSQADEGSGGGVGCRITPTAVLVVREDDVKLVRLTGKGSLETLLENVPELLEKIQGLKQGSSGETPEEKEHTEQESEQEEKKEEK